VNNRGIVGEEEPRIHRPDGIRSAGGRLHPTITRPGAARRPRQTRSAPPVRRSHRKSETGQVGRRSRDRGRTPAITRRGPEPGSEGKPAASVPRRTERRSSMGPPDCGCERRVRPAHPSQGTGSLLSQPVSTVGASSGWR
jgi:hypothetical protein